jgi:tetratricopeptide (TPR) repeat protein
MRLSATNTQRLRYSWIKKLTDGRKLSFGLLAISFVLLFIPFYLIVSFLQSAAAEREAFAVVRGPGISQAEKATPAGFEREVSDLAVEKAAEARDYFASAEKSFAGKLYSLAADEYAQSLAGLPTLAAHLNEGICLRWLGKTSAAEKVFTTGLCLARKNERRDYESQFLFNIGTLFVIKGDQQAPQTLIHALELFKETGDFVGQANANMNLGVWLSNTGHADKAIGRFRQAGELFKKAANNLGQANAGINVGNYLADKLQFKEAEAQYATSLAIYQSIDNPQGEVAALNGLGSILFNQSRYDSAIAVYKKSSGIAKRYDLGREIGFAAANLGHALIQKGQKGSIKEGLQREAEALAFGEKSQDLEIEGYAMLYQGIAYRGLGRTSDAIKRFEESFDKFTTAQYAQGQLEALIALGDTYLRDRLGKAAIDVCTKALTIARASQDIQNQAKALSCIGWGEHDLKDEVAALKALQEADAIYKRFKIDNVRSRDVTYMLDVIHGKKDLSPLTTEMTP